MRGVISELGGCLACDLNKGDAPLPGGVIHQTEQWRVEHCIGPLGVGTLIVKPVRHVTHIADLTDAETAELAPLLRQAARACTDLTHADQIYVCLWSHADRKPGHIHFVVQPVSAETMRRFDAHGPALQVAMFRAGHLPNADDITAFSERARSWFADQSRP
jgi:diadenosine tetraphosphate (Ap4A) HIT family hydrolase